jgi:hypothetical protein
VEVAHLVRIRGQRLCHRHDVAALPQLGGEAGDELGRGPAAILQEHGGADLAAGGRPDSLGQGLGIGRDAGRIAVTCGSTGKGRHLLGELGELPSVLAHGGGEALAVGGKVGLELAPADSHGAELVLEALQDGLEFLLRLAQPDLEAIDPPLRRIRIGADLLDQHVQALLGVPGEIELHLHLGDAALGLLGHGRDGAADQLADEVVDDAVAGEAHDEEGGRHHGPVAHLERALDPVAHPVGEPPLQELHDLRVRGIAHPILHAMRDAAIASLPDRGEQAIAPWPWRRRAGRNGRLPRRPGSGRGDEGDADPVGTLVVGGGAGPGRDGRQCRRAAGGGGGRQLGL